MFTIYHYGTYNAVLSYLPKLTITSVPITTAPVRIDDNGYTTFASPWPLDLTSDKQTSLGLTAYRATIIDTGSSKVKFSSDIDQTVAANTGLLLAGTAGET